MFKCRIEPGFFYLVCALSGRLNIIQQLRWSQLVQE